MAQGFLEHYFAAYTDKEGGVSPLLQTFADAAAQSFHAVGCHSFDDAKAMLEGIIRRDEIVHTAFAGLGGGGGYTLGMTVFIEKIAPLLRPDLPSVIVGLMAGLFVGFIDAVWSSASGSIRDNHLYGKKVPTEPDAEPEILKAARPGMVKTILVAAGMSACYTALKNSSRIFAPAIFPGMERTSAGKLDHWLDAGGSFPAAAAAGLHAYRNLHGKLTPAALLCDPNLDTLLEEYCAGFSWQAVVRGLAQDARTLVTSTWKASRSPSTWLVTAYIGGMVAALLHAKHLVGLAHEHDPGYSAERMGRAEGMQRGAVSTVMMSALASGATAIGIGASVLVDPLVDTFCTRLSDFMADRAFPTNGNRR